MGKVSLLDCSLRDGGYINEWNWGYKKAKTIIHYLAESGVENVEVGFLRNIPVFDRNFTVSDSIERLNDFLPENTKDTIYCAMAMNGDYDIRKLCDNKGNGINLIRVTSHDYDIEDGLSFAGVVQDKGYKVSFNPINIMGYSDEQILRLCERVNKLHPFRFSIVDTFGSMKHRDLDRIVSIIDHNIERDIILGLHLHENMAMSFSLAQKIIEKHINRDITIDGSLAGIGRTPGNLPIELIADYLNDVENKVYDIDYMMDAIQDYIIPLKGEARWGYNPVFFLSAKYNLHRNYAEYYLNKGNLTSRDINHILSRFERKYATSFSQEYAEKAYLEYENNKIDDSMDYNRLKEELEGKSVLVLAPGPSIRTHREDINAFINTNHPIVFFVNFTTDMYDADYVFFGNNKRFNQNIKTKSKIITTSNIDCDSDYKIDYNSITGAFRKGNNTLIMLLLLLKRAGVKTVSIAGADGFTNTENYYSSSIKNVTDKDSSYNIDVSDAIKNLKISVTFITPSKYLI